MFAAFLPLLATQGSDYTTLTQGLVIGNVSAGGRRPFPTDAIVDQLVAGTFATPVAGGTVTFRGRKEAWKSLVADKDGWFDDPALDNGYLAIQVNESAPTDLILNATGDSLVYVNGAPRTGDPYGYGYLNQPIHLNAGPNLLLFVAGRGRISVKTRPVAKPLSLQEADATLPDLIVGSKESVWASVIALNGQGKFASGLSLRARAKGGKWMTVPNATIPPYSERKLMCRIPTPSGLTAGQTTFDVELQDHGKTVDFKTLQIQVKNPLDLQKQTFVSEIDGSVQYFAVRPAAKPSEKNALVLTLHGASVEALGQAAAYTQKDWATIVAPTNRRPYGFDWEGVGRLDALEVLDLAKKEFPHDPERVDLTGHSMGGHGTWSIGTMFPGLFASIAPSAGWISFWSYAGGWNPPKTNPALDLVRRSMNVGDTLGRLDNTLSENVYILHGSADDNVPVEQARTMKADLDAIHHPSVQFHEQPGAGHWWGNQCVDWPPIFQMIEDSRLNLNSKHIDFTTQNPAAASTDRWLTVSEQIVSLAPSHVVADRGPSGDVTLKTENVAALSLANLESGVHVMIDGQQLPPASGYKFRAGKWSVGSPKASDKSTERGSGFKQVFNHRFAFVVGTDGTPEENDWALSRAIFYAETMMYRGNGAVDVVLDKEFSPSRFRGRSLVLFGNEKTNLAWRGLLGKLPVKPQADGTALLAIYPKPGETQTLVASVGGQGLSGMRLTDRLPLFTSGVDYPDVTVFDPAYQDGVSLAEFFGNDWKADPKQTAEGVKK